MSKVVVRQYYIDRYKVYAELDNEYELDPKFEESMVPVVKMMAQFYPKTIDDITLYFNGKEEVHRFTLKWFSAAYIKVEMEEVNKSGE